MKSWVLGLTMTGLLACAPVQRPDGGVGLLPIGSSAPDIVARDATQNEVHLSDLRGRVVVVYFYPADGTPGCTAEACAFRDAWKKYDASHVSVIGVSTDGAESHRKFQHDEKLPFPLAADENGSIGKAYGVTKTVLGYDRVSFLVDGQGRVVRVWSEVDPGVHADEVLREAKRVQRDAL
jgi:peroxiredoxin Q/BCP